MFSVKEKTLMPAIAEEIESKIFLIRGQRVMIDSDLAKLYGVKTFNLNKAVKRNSARFPKEFMFQLTKEEYRNLIFQIGISSSPQQWGGRRGLPYAFTEHGIAMLSSVLHSDRAVQINIIVIKTFIRLRQFLSTHKDLSEKLRELEKKVLTQGEDIQTIFTAIRAIIAYEEKPKKKIGFLSE